MVEHQRVKVREGRREVHVRCEEAVLAAAAGFHGGFATAAAAFVVALRARVDVEELLLIALVETPICQAGK